jgi:hypothetical protein
LFAELTDFADKGVDGLFLVGAAIGIASHKPTVQSVSRIPNQADVELAGFFISSVVVDGV